MKRKWIIVISIVIGLILLVVGATETQLYWFIQHVDEFTGAGAEFGRKADNTACVEESLLRYQRDSSMRGSLAARTFLESCLEASHPTPGFCNDVPREKEIMKTVTWTREQCRQAGLKWDKNCRKFFTKVQEHCQRSNDQDYQGAAR